MAKTWKDTYEEDLLQEEIKKYPLGTSPEVIYDNIHSKVWTELDLAGRTGGKTGRRAVYRQLCHMIQREKLSQKPEFEMIIEETISNIQKSCEEIIKRQLKELEQKLKDVKSS